MKITITKFLFFLFTALFILVNNQQVGAQNLHELFDEKYAISKDSARAFSNRLLASDNAINRAFGYISKGHICNKEGDYDKAQQAFDAGFLEITKIENNTVKSREKMYALYYYSLFLLTTHSMEEVNEKINEGYDLALQMKNAKMQINFKNLIGRGYSLSSLGKRAIANGIETIQSIRNLKSELPKDYYTDQLLRIYLNTAYRTLNYYTQDSIINASYLDSTAAYVARAESFIKEENFTPSKIRQRQLLNLKSDILYNRKDYKQAIKFYQRTVIVSKALGMKKRVYQSKFRLAESYFYNGEYQQAKKIFDQISTKDLQQYKLLKNAVVIKYYYAQIYSKLGDIEKAAKYIETFQVQIEEFYRDMSANTIDVLTQNELNEKKQILDNLAKEEKTNSYLMVFLTSVFLLVVFLFFYMRNQRRKFQVKIDDLLKNIEKSKAEKSTTVQTIKEAKAKKLLLKLSKIEDQELFLNKNYSLNMVAKKIDSNSSYVSQIINTYWNKSFVDYTNELRINYILKKLKEDRTYQKFTLLAIAESVGYKSLSSFNKHFKNIAGITPKQYLSYLKVHSEK